MKIIQPMLDIQALKIHWKMSPMNLTTLLTGMLSCIVFVYNEKRNSYIKFAFCPPIRYLYFFFITFMCWGQRTARSSFSKTENRRQTLGIEPTLLRAQQVQSLWNVLPFPIQGTILPTHWTRAWMSEFYIYKWSLRSSCFVSLVVNVILKKDTQF